MLSYAVVFIIAASITFFGSFAVRRFTTKYKIMVIPDERMVHQKPTPTAGGVAMFVAFGIALFVASQLPQFRSVFKGSSEPMGVFVGAFIIFAVGLFDDLKDISAPTKLAGQVLAASVLYLFGVTMFYFRIPFAGLVILSPGVTPLLTAIWVTGMANAVNFIDGLDGLAAGIVAIASIAFFIYGIRLQDVGLLSSSSISPLLAIIVFGLTIGFLPHNFHPAKIFMGDAGALLLGLLMAASTIVVGGRSTQAFSGETYFFFAPLFIPFFILGVPILDTAFAIVRRAVKHKGLSSPDKDHLHHRLMRLGHGHKRSVLILWAWTAILSGFVLYPTFTNQGNAIAPFVVGVLGIILYTLFHPGIRHKSANIDHSPKDDKNTDDKNAQDKDQLKSRS